MDFPTEFTRRAFEGLKDFGPSLTKQEFLEEADIHSIIRRFMKDGTLPLQTKSPLFGVQPVQDLHAALNLISQASEDFLKLPSDIRRSMGDDPANAEAFLKDPSNFDMLVKRGILVPRVVPKSDGGGNPPASKAPSAPPVSKSGKKGPAKPDPVEED